MELDRAIWEQGRYMYLLLPLIFKNHRDSAVTADKLPVQQTSTLQTNPRDVTKSQLPANFSGWKRAYHQLKLKEKQSCVGILEMQMSKTASETKKKSLLIIFLATSL